MRAHFATNEGSAPCLSEALPDRWPPRDTDRPRGVPASSAAGVRPVVMYRATGFSYPPSPPCGAGLDLEAARDRSRIIKPVAKERKNPYAVALGRKGGKVGGPARAAKMTPEERSESARNAVLARWAKTKNGGRI
jgi:hypothetical protein